MDFVAARTLEEAFDALDVEEARCLAGGQSLVAMMNLGLVEPARLVSLRGIEALRGITPLEGGGMRLGAMTTHAEIAALRPTAPGPSLVAQAARVVAYPAVRAWGTIGGSVAHFDPAADYPVALVAANATVEVASRRGTRVVAARSFFRGLFETALTPGEIVTAVCIPSGPPSASARYEKLSLVAGDFGIVSIAALVGDSAEVAIGGFGHVPLVASGLSTEKEALLHAGRALAQASNPVSDHRASAAYRRRVLPPLMQRAVLAARASRP